MVLLVLFCLSKYEERQSRYDHNRSQLARVHHRVEPQIKPPPVQQRDDVKKGKPFVRALYSLVFIFTALVRLFIRQGKVRHLIGGAKS